MTITPILQPMIVDISVFGAVVVFVGVIVTMVVAVVVAVVVTVGTVSEVVTSIEVIEVTGVVRVVRVPAVVAVEGAVVQTVVAIEPGEPTNIRILDAFERTQADPQSVRSKAEAR